jgi:hypothetical protein
LSYDLILSSPTTNLRHFYDVHGNWILDRHPGRVMLVFSDKLRGKLPERPDCRVEYLQYLDDASITELVLRIAATEGVASIATLDEQLVELAADLRARLALPGMQPEVARRFRNKVVMKRLLRDAGLRTPEFVADCADAAAVRALLARHGRIVVKPHDGMGSKGVSVIGDAAALEACLAGLRKPETYEAEEFIDGVLYHTNSVIAAGRVLYTGVAPYQEGMANIDYTAGTPFVTFMETSGERCERLRAFSAEVVRALGIENGVTHLEAFVRRDGEIVFCEVGARPGGGGIVYMVDLQDGVNLALAALLGDAGAVDQALAGTGYRDGRIGLIGLRNSGMGVVQLAPTAAALTRDWIHHSEIHVTDGVFRAPSAHCTDFTALFVLNADDPAQFAGRIKDIETSFSGCMQLRPL